MRGCTAQGAVLVSPTRLSTRQTSSKAGSHHSSESQTRPTFSLATTRDRSAQKGVVAFRLFSFVFVFVRFVSFVFVFVCCVCFVSFRACSHVLAILNREQSTVCRADRECGEERGNRYH